jgi:hypothetical protein
MGRPNHEPSALRQEDGRRGAELASHVLDDDAQDIADARRGGDVTREGVQRRRPALAAARRLCRTREVRLLVRTATSRNTNSDRRSCGFVTVKVRRGSTKKKS